MNDKQKTIKKLDELTNFFTERKWDLEKFREIIRFELEYQKKKNKIYTYKFPEQFNFIKLSENYAYTLDSYKLVLGLRRTKKDLQGGTITKYWNVYFEGTPLGTNFPIISEDVTGFIILNYFKKEKILTLHNLQATVIDEFGDEDDIFDDKESLSEIYDKFKPWKYADRLLLLAGCANYIAQKLNIQTIKIRKEDYEDYSIYKRAYDFLSRNIEDKVQIKLT
jgi:hypothetical protein